MISNKYHSKQFASYSSRQELLNTQPSSQAAILIQQQASPSSSTLSPQFSQQKKVQRQFPKFSLTEFNEAVKRNILQLDKESKLLVKPEKYNIFFLDLDYESPVIKEALFNLKIDKQECDLQKYDDFKDDSVPEIYAVMNYLMYLKSKYTIIKAVIKERNRIKSMQREANRIFQRTLPFQFLKTQSIDMNQNDSNQNLFITNEESTNKGPRTIRTMKKFKSKSRRLDSTLFNDINTSFDFGKNSNQSQVQAYQLTQNDKINKLKQNSQREKKVIDNLNGIRTEFESTQKSFYKEMISNKEDIHMKQRNAAYLQKKQKAKKCIDKINNTISRIKEYQHMRIQSDMERLERMEEENMDHAERKNKRLNEQLRKIQMMNCQRNMKLKRIYKEQENEKKELDEKIPETMELLAFQSFEFQQNIADQHNKKIEKIHKHEAHSEQVREKYKNYCQQKEFGTIDKLLKKFGAGGHQRQQQKEDSLKKLLKEHRKKNQKHFERTQVNKQILQQDYENNISSYKQNLKEWEESQKVQKKSMKQKAIKDKKEKPKEKNYTSKYQAIQLKNFINQQKLEEKKQNQQELITEALRLRIENQQYRNQNFNKIVQ